jgi:hypothetical protein
MMPGAVKGKAPQGARSPSSVRRPASPPSGFKADARHVPERRRQQMSVHTAIVGAPPSTPDDDDGWQQQVMRKKRRARPRVVRQPSRRSGKVPADLVGLCFNCLRCGHVARSCRNPSSCLRCRKPGHRAKDCNRPRVVSDEGRPLGQRRSPSPVLSGPSGSYVLIGDVQVPLLQAPSSPVNDNGRRCIGPREGPCIDLRGSQGSHSKGTPYKPAGSQELSPTWEPSSLAWSSRNGRSPLPSDPMSLEASMLPFATQQGSTAISSGCACDMAADFLKLGR